MKVLRKNKICDIYLRHLSKSKSDTVPFLTRVLDNKKIHYDQELIDSVIEKLLSKNLIQEIPNSISISFYPTKTLNNSMTAETSKQLLENKKGQVKQYEITNKGHEFLKSKNRLDKKGVKKSRQNLKYIGVYILGLISTLLIEWLKQFF